MAIAGCAINPSRNVDVFAQNSGRYSFEPFDRRVRTDALVMPLEQDPQRDGASCGAHVLATAVNYWRGPGTLDGSVLYRTRPPSVAAGYSMAELLQFAREHGMVASAVALPEAGLVSELEAGRPVIVPVRVPSVYVQNRSLPAPGPLALARNVLISRMALLSRVTGLAMVDHYLLVVGRSGDMFVVVEPVMGYRTIGASRLARYRNAFNDAAIVMSADSSRTE